MRRGGGITVNHSQDLNSGVDLVCHSVGMANIIVNSVAGRWIVASEAVKRSHADRDLTLGNKPAQLSE